MNRSLQILIGVLSVGLALAAGIYGRNLYLQEVSTYKVPVPIQTIQPYTVLSEDQFQLREMPRAMANLPYFQSISDMEGLISTTTIPAGLPVTKTSAVPAAQFRLADARYEVVSIPVAPVSAVGGQIQIGQRVNLYQMVEEQPDSDLVAGSETEFGVEAIASSVLVVDVRNSQGAQARPANTQAEAGTFSGSNQVEQVQILTLALEPDLVQKVLAAVALSEKQGGLLWTTLGIP